MPSKNTRKWGNHWKSVIQGKLDQGLGADGPGGSIVALENNVEVMAHNFGKASVANNINFTVDTPCGIRSVTKAITASLALVAEQFSQWGWLTDDGAAHNGGGLLDKQIRDFTVIDASLHDESNKYFPNGRNAPVVHKNCTLRHLAAHQARIVSIWGLYSGFPVDREILKKLMESIGNIDDIVRQTGAVQQGMSSEQRFSEVTDPQHVDFGLEAWSDWGLQDYRRNYNDKAHWITGAILEQLFGTSLYQLMETQFNNIGLDHAYPSYDGNLIGNGSSLGFKGHFSNPIEIPGLAVAYNSYRGPNSDELYLEPEQSTESGYAIGSAVMSCRDLAKWAHELRWGNSIFGLPPAMQAQLFSVQTQSDSPSIIDPSLSGDYVYPSPTGPNDWPGVNWGFGPQKLESVQGRSGQTVELWGNIGQGGFGGYGGCVVWVEHGGTKLVVAANSNTGTYVKDAYHVAKDYIENFL
jgi:CubicO group peptidase (beta-lactamase class C family)